MTGNMEVTWLQFNGQPVPLFPPRPQRSRGLQNTYIRNKQYEYLKNHGFNITEIVLRLNINPSKP